MSLTYTTYLNIDKLLQLQEPQSDPVEHDEMLFIIIHQSYELWFKQILHEFGKLRPELEDGNTWAAAKTMRRVLTILKTMVSQIDILETMTPLEFNSFRGFLQQASGFQSVQFREMEIICGIRSKHIIDVHSDQPTLQQQLIDREKEPTLWESFCRYLKSRGYDVETPEREENDGLIHSPSPHNQALLVDIMNSDPEAALLCELFVDYDEGLQEWRYRHVKMVERTIGTKKGTGGSDGAKYLRSTLNQPIFPDLWEIRTLF
jgi:tryptophan 2,3-dioxygenase